MKIHFLENGDIDFSKVTASIEEINYQIHYLSTQCELEEDEFQANEAELNYLCEIREYLEGIQKSFQTTFGVDVVEFPTQSEQLPDDYEQLHRDICDEANGDLAMEINEFNLPTISKNGFATDEVPILPDSYEIIHANPFGSTDYRLVGTVYAFSLEGAYRMTQNDSDNSVDLKTRSTSVGDIIGHDGKYFMVKGIGFEEVDNPFPMNEI